MHYLRFDLRSKNASQQTAIFMPPPRNLFATALFVISASVALIATNACVAQPLCEKTVRWNNDPPYSMRDAQGKVTGFYVDLVEEILTKMNCTMKLQEMPWARALSELEAGRIDILPGALQTSDRNRFALFSDPINFSSNVLFMKKTAIDQFNLKNLADIPKINFRLGVQVNVAYGAEFDQLLKEPAFLKQLTTVYKRHNAWKMVDINRIDGLIADEVTGLLELKTLHLDNTISKTNLVVSSSPGLVAFSKKTIGQRFIEEFNQQLQAMISSGNYAKIHEKHIPCKLSLSALGCK
jgi:polar amino acid transport system substrate-binding protein